MNFENAIDKFNDKLNAESKESNVLDGFTCYRVSNAINAIYCYNNCVLIISKQYAQETLSKLFEKQKLNA